MDLNLGTLEKIEYQNLQQFIDAVNRNFAVVQNSPLFKGIPGDEGDDGLPGPKGERGSKIFFVDFVKFNLQFPTEITLSNQIDIVFLNSKLSDNTGKTKVLNAIGTPNLVDKDIFVLTNSLLVSYNYAENKFYDTGKSLNSSITDEIQSIINNLFQSYLPQLQSGIKNIFENYSTLAKNYSDTNNTGITTSVNSTSVYSPFIQGVTSNIGIPIENHKYYGLSTNVSPESGDNTIVFGNLTKYYKLLMNTINTNGSQTITSDYSPGVNNIPTAIFLQDTYNNGLLFGFKGKQNLKTFGSIFKNDADELEIKSDSGKLISDYSSLKIHKDRMRYNKLVQFNDSLEISQNLFFGNSIKSNLINSGNFAHQKDTEGYLNVDLRKTLVLGSVELYDSAVQIRGSQINFPAQKNLALVTDNFGNIADYIIENSLIVDNFSATTFSQLQEITTGISTKRILTTYYYNYLVRRINNLYNNYIDGLYWKKSEFETNVIPNLKLNNSLSVDNSFNFGSMLIGDKTSNKINILPTELTISSPNVLFKNYLNKVLVTDSNGALKNNVSVHYETFLNSTVGLQEITITQNNFQLITTYHYNQLLRVINNVINNISSNFWTKQDFESFIIPKLNTSNGFFTKGSIVVNSTINNGMTNGGYLTDTNNLFYSNVSSNANYLGGDLTYLFSNVTRIKGFTDKQILGTNNRGDIKPYNLIGTLTLQNNSLPSLANNNIITLADNNTIASLIEWNNTNNVNLSNYINSQISLLSQQLNNKIDTLISEVNTKINIINNDLINIHNELATKATLSYVNDAINNVWNTVNNHTTQINQHTTQIADIYSKLNSKVDKSVFEPWKQIVDDFMANTVQLPKGAIILWEGRNPTNGTLDGTIPNDDWEEVISMRGRVPVGWDSEKKLDLNIFGNNFYVLGDELGSAYVTLSAKNIPKHRHRTAYDEKSGTLLKSVPDSAIATYRTAGNSDADYELAGVNKEPNVGWTGWSGGLNGSTQPFKALQPYKVLIYIRSKKGV